MVVVRVVRLEEMVRVVRVREEMVRVEEMVRELPPW